MDLTPTLTPMHQYGKSVQENAYMEMYTGHAFVEESSLRIQGKDSSLTLDQSIK